MSWVLVTLQAHLLLSLKSMALSLVCWATIWDWTKDTQSFSASSGAISYPSVLRAGGREPWERGCNLSKSCIDHLFCCSNVESLSSIRRHIPHTLSWMRYKLVVWRKCKREKKTQTNDSNKCHQNWTMSFNFYKKIFTLGEIGFNFKLKEKLKVLFYRTDRWIGAVPGRLWVV